MIGSYVTCLNSGQNVSGHLSLYVLHSLLSSSLQVCVLEYIITHFTHTEKGVSYWIHTGTEFSSSSKNLSALRLDAS